jgi:hypothetical protein
MKRTHMTNITTIAALASGFRLHTRRRDQQFTAFLGDLLVLAIDTALLISLELCDLRFQAVGQKVSFSRDGI